MSHTVQKLPYFFINETASELQTAQKSYKLPCLLRSDSNNICVLSHHASLKNTLLDLTLSLKPVIILIGTPLQVSAQEQREWVVFGQEHGFIFQWQNRHRTIEIFNLLCEEKRICLAFLI